MSPWTLGSCDYILTFHRLNHKYINKKIIISELFHNENKCYLQPYNLETASLVTAPRQEIVQPVTQQKIAISCFYTLSFVQIRQIRYNIFIIEL